MLRAVHKLGSFVNGCTCRLKQGAKEMVLLYHAAHLEYFFSILLPRGAQDTFLDPKFDEEHDARISFGHRPPAACARAGQSQPT